MKRGKGVLLALAGLILAAGGIVLIKTIPDPQQVMRALPYLLVGIGCGLLGHGMGDILEKRAAKKDPEFARKMDIEVRDERNVMIGNQAKAKGFSMSTYVYGALMLALALMGTSYTVIIPLVAAYLFVQGYALFIRFRLEKSQ